nr:molybdenum cofactor guanylyltransferase [Fontibacillus phaseoli]
MLAGGRSSRMGQNKALLPVGGVPVIERLIRELEEVAAEILIAGGSQPEAYNHLGKDVISDVFPGLGPLAGLHAGLQAASTSWSLTVACDMPFANRDVFQWLAERALLAEEGQKRDTVSGEAGSALEAVIPIVQGQVQPLLASYRRSVLPGLERELQAGNLKLTRWTEALRAEYVNGFALAAAAGMPQERIPFNMNRPGDYRQALDWLDASTDKGKH